MNECKGLCSTNQFLIDRRAKRTKSIWTPLTKLCDKCGFYYNFLTQEEYNDNLYCPCCGKRYRARAFGKWKEKRRGIDYTYY